MAIILEAHGQQAAAPSHSSGAVAHALNVDGLVAVVNSDRAATLQVAEARAAAAHAHKGEGCCP